MKIAVRVGKVAAFALALPLAAMAQTTGVSHPDDTPIVNTPDAPAYDATPSTQMPASLKPHPGTPVETPAPTITASTRMPEPMLNAALNAALDAGKNAPVVDVDAGIVTRIPGPANQLPIGTLIKVKLLDNIATDKTVNGSKFTAQLIEGVERDGQVLLPAGATLSGVVTDIHGGRRMSGAASLHLRTTAVTLPDGTSYPLHGQVIDTNLFKETKVDREGTIYRRDHPGKVASGMALTTGSGMAAGAVVAGVPGALIGAGVGAGVSTVVWLKQDRQMDLGPQTKVTFWLTDPLTVGSTR